MFGEDLIVLQIKCYADSQGTGQVLCKIPTCSVIIIININCEVKKTIELYCFVYTALDCLRLNEQ